MNRYLSDFLPPSLVLDIRRTLRSRVYVVTLLLVLLAAVWLQYAAIEAQENASGTFDSSSSLLVVLATIMMWFIIPNRAAGAVSADAKVKGTNFMMLTPLSSRRIIWGTWFSSVFQLLLVAALGALVMWWRHSAMVEPAAGGGESFVSRLVMTFMPAADDRALQMSREWTMYGLLVGTGVVMCAVFLFLAQLSRFFRVMAGLAALAFIWGGFSPYFITTEWFTQPGYDPIGYFLDQFSGCSLYVWAADAAVLVWVLLELARRAYASPAENCSRGVRLIALLPIISVPLLYLLLPGEVELLRAQCEFAMYFAVFACMSDALLPTYSLPAHAKRSWVVLPRCLQVPGVGQAALYVVLVLALCQGLHLWLQTMNGEVDCGYFRITVENLRQGEYGGLLYMIEIIKWLTLSYTLLFTLLLTDLFCKRTNVNRPVVFGVILMALMIFGTMLVAFISIHDNAPIGWELCMSAVLPGVCCNVDGGLLGGMIPVDGEVFAVMWKRACVIVPITACGMLLSLALLMLRGRKRM